MKNDFQTPERHTLASVYEDHELYRVSQRIIPATLLLSIFLNYTITLMALRLNFQDTEMACCALNRDGFLLLSGRVHLMCYRISLVASVSVGALSAIPLLLTYKNRVIERRQAFPVTFDSILLTLLVVIVFLAILYFIFLYAPASQPSRPHPKMAAVFLWPGYPALAGFGSAILTMSVFLFFGALWKCVIYREIQK